MKKISANGLLLLLLGLAAAGCVITRNSNGWHVPEEAKGLKSPVPVSEATLAAGKAVYAEQCANCHGDAGNGRGPEAKLYSVKPSDFTEVQVMRRMTDGEIFWKISHGCRPMPGFGRRLTEAQRWEVVNYLRTFAPTLLPASEARPPKAPAPTH